MNPHDAVVAGSANEPGFLSVVRSSVFVILNAGRKLQALADGMAFKDTRKIDPLPAIIAPCLAAERFPHAPGE